MSSLTEDVKEWAKSGGVLVRVEFLDAAGNVEEQIPDRIATDYRLTPGKFAYLPMEQERPHFAHLSGFWKDGDEWVLQADNKRIYVGPLAYDDQVKEAKQWRSSPEFPDVAIEEMDQVFNEM